MRHLFVYSLFYFLFFTLITYFVCQCPSKSFGGSSDDTQAPAQSSQVCSVDIRHLVKFCLLVKILIVTKKVVEKVYKRGEGEDKPTAVVSLLEACEH